MIVTALQNRTKQQSKTKNRQNKVSDSPLNCVETESVDYFVM